jgi:hypothetical protein
MIVSTHGILKSPIDALDIDVRAFANATGITNASIRDALQVLVTTLKTNSMWAKFDAIYPFVGGTAFTHKFNLKNPLDTNGAFRLQFFGGVTHSANGFANNGASYANTFYNENTSGSLNNKHISVYSRTNTTGLQIDMGVSNLASNATDIVARYNSGGEKMFMRNGSLSGSVANTDSRGFFLNNRRDSANIQYQRNAVITPVVNASISLNNGDYFIGAVCNIPANTPAFYTSREYAFATIGQGFSNAEAVILYNAIQVFQTSLSRQV